MKNYFTIVKQEVVIDPDANLRELGYVVLPWMPIYQTQEAAMDAVKILHSEGFPIGWVVIRMGQLFEILDEVKK